MDPLKYLPSTMPGEFNEAARNMESKMLEHVGNRSRRYINIITLSIIIIWDYK